MGFDFDRLKKDIVSVGKDVGDKVSDMSSVAKVKIDIHTKEDFIEKQFTELGRAYYLAHKNEEDIPEKAFFKPIAEAEAEVARLKDELLVMQGAQVCPKCGGKVPKGNSFCSVCGQKLSGE